MRALLKVIHEALVAIKLRGRAFDVVFDVGTFGSGEDGGTEGSSYVAREVCMHVFMFSFRDNPSELIETHADLNATLRQPTCCYRPIT